METPGHEASNKIKECIQGFPRKSKTSKKTQKRIKSLQSKGGEGGEREAGGRQRPPVNCSGLLAGIRLQNDEISALVKLGHAPGRAGTADRKQCREGARLSALVFCLSGSADSCVLRRSGLCLFCLARLERYAPVAGWMPTAPTRALGAGREARCFFPARLVWFAPVVGWFS